MVEVIEGNAVRIEGSKKEGRREKSYALGKTLRPGTWEQTRAVGEVEMGVETDESMVQALEMKPRVAKVVPKRKFMDL
jgi:hypothetical protein